MPDTDVAQRFTALYDNHHRQVYAYVVSRAGHQIADEVVSDTFLVAWRRFADLPDPALPWLFGVARNLLREQSRAQRARDSLAAELRTWTTPADDTGTDPADLVADRSAALTALAALSEDDREVLVLAAWHGLSAAEAAQVIGCSTPAYWVRLHRARKRLEQALKSRPAQPAPRQRKGRV